jgi:predicted ATPase with chaperone activity
VLFLDELPEFRGNVLERLRRPFEERRLTVARGSVAAEPASVRELSVFCP